jgi:NAD(P)-dependent dehydrogenase (short-subunit alcohol dehydrogenase family)
MARIFITGSTDGLGLAAARSLIGDGHEVVLHARTPERVSAIADIAALGVVVGDLVSAAETRGVADQVNAIGRMDAVIHNAGVYSVPERGSTHEGHAVTVAINTLAPFILTALIERPDRLIYLSSKLHHGGSGPLQDLDWTERRWDSARAYGESKLHLAALAGALARRWPTVLGNAVDPGWVRTRMGGANAAVDIETGAHTQAWLAASNDPAALVSGGYWRHMEQEQPAGEVTDTSYQDRLVAALQDMTGVELG